MKFFYYYFQQEQITQKNLDLLYGRYVQSLFFESKMRKVNIEQEKLATVSNLC